MPPGRLGSCPACPQPSTRAYLPPPPIVVAARQSLDNSDFHRLPIRDPADFIYVIGVRQLGVRPFTNDEPWRPAAR